MEFNTFDEGVITGGIKNKNDIRMLICYLICAVGKPMTKKIVMESLQKKSLANYFETSTCFDDMIRLGNIELVDKEKELYFPTENGKIIFEQLESNLPLTIREKAYACALELLEQQRIEEENLVTIEQTDKGYNVNCTISGGSVNLFSFSIYAPDANMARRIKKNFHKDPEMIYKTMIAMLTKDNEAVKDALEYIDSIS